MTDFTLSRIIITQNPHKHRKPKFVGKTCCRLKITICFVVVVIASAYNYRAEGCFYLLLGSQKEKKPRKHWGCRYIGLVPAKIENKAKFSQFRI